MKEVYIDVLIVVIIYGPFLWLSNIPLYIRAILEEGMATHYCILD